ncbi:MAG: ATP-binding protein [Fibrobacterota bacterium]
MRFLRNIPIRKKISFLIIFACVVSLLVTTGVLVLFELSTYRRRALEDARTQAAILSMNLHAPLVFGHEQAAQRVLRSLQLKPSIVSAYVMNAEGKYLASYSQSASDTLLPAEPDSPEVGYRFSEGYLFLTRRVIYEQQTVGYLTIQYSLANLLERLPGYGIAILSLLVALILVGIVLDSGFRDLIVRRLDRLAHVAGQISSKKDYSIRAFPNGQDELGVFTQALNAMLDTIETQNKEIRHSEQRLRLAMEASRIGIWQWDTRNHSIHLDTSFVFFPEETSTGSVSEKQFFSYVHPDDRKRLRTSLRKGCIKRTSIRTEFRFFSKGGRMRWLSIQGKFVIPDSEEIMLGVVIDVTSRKEAEIALAKSERRLREHAVELSRTNQMLREKNRELDRANAQLKEVDAMKTEFVSLASHELRTPITGILGFAETLTAKDIHLTRAEQDKYLTIIAQESKRLGMLISDLLDISKIEKGIQEMSENVFDMGQLLKDTVASIRIPEGIHVSLSLPDSRPLVIEGDSSRMRQVILNILDNAIRQSFPDGHIHLSAGYQNNRVIVSIRDTGTGIRQEELNKIFEKFYRSKFQMRTESRGSGLGLTVAREIVEAHNGKIWAESDYGKGATFYISLPAATVAHAATDLQDL